MSHSLLLAKVKTSTFFITAKKFVKLNNPGRSVISSIKCHKCRISDFVDHYLHLAVVKLKAYVKDTTDFIEKMKPLIA